MSKFDPKCSQSSSQVILRRIQHSIPETSNTPSARDIIIEFKSKKVMKFYSHTIPRSIYTRIPGIAYGAPQQPSRRSNVVALVRPRIECLSFLTSLSRSHGVWLQLPYGTAARYSYGLIMGLSKSTGTIVEPSGSICQPFLELPHLPY